MKKNIGNTDKVVRILIAITITIGVLYFTSVISGALAIISGALAIILGVVVIVFLLTVFISFCPFYVLLGINTSKKRKK